MLRGQDARATAGETPALRIAFAGFCALEHCGRLAGRSKGHPSTIAKFCLWKTFLVARWRSRFASCILPGYFGTLVRVRDDSKLEIERVQTGVRIEKRILKVLKAFAEYHDMTLGDVLEGIVLHAFDGKTPFSPASLERIRELKKFYALDLDSSASHRLKEIKARGPRKRAGK